MVNVFQTETSNLLIWSKILGLMHCSYTFKTGLLTRNTINSTYYFCVECTWIFAMLFCTYSVHLQGVFFSRQYYLIKYWLLICIGRLSETHVVKFINDIIAFDRKQLMLLRPSLINNSLATNKCITLNRILIVLLIYFILYNSLKTYRMPPKVYDLPSISFIFFSDPNLLDMVIVTGGCFYIRSVASRFCALNDAYRRLPLGLVEIPGEWTQSQITMSLECLRLLHADLCKIIKVFSLGYGMILLGYFTFSFVGLLIFTYLYFAVGYKDIPDMSFASVILWCLPLVVRYCQHCIFHISIVVNASYANEKKREIILYLRACRISSLAIHTKLQIKMFMIQMSEFKSNEMSAYGMFNINLHLVISNLLLLLYGLTTLIQMKDGPFVSSLTKAVTKHFIQQYNNIKNYTNS